MSGKFRKILCTSTIIAGLVLTASAVSAGPKAPSISVPNISPPRPDIHLRAPNILREQDADDDRSSQTKTRKSLKHRKNTHKTTAKKKNVNEKNIGSTGGNSTGVKTPPAMQAKTPGPDIAPPNVVPPAVRVHKPGPNIGDRVGEAERARRDAGAAGTLQGNSGAEAKMHPAAPANPLTGGTGIQTLDRMAELCKLQSARALGLCAGFPDGSKPMIDPQTGEIHYNTGSSVGPSGKYHGPTGFGAARAGPNRDGRASGDGKPVRVATNPDGSTEDFTIYKSEDGDMWVEELTVRDANKRPTTRVYVDHTPRGVTTTIIDIRPTGETETLVCTNGECIHPIHIDDQPGETAQATGNFRSSFFCQQNPGNPNCQPLKAGFEIDPANPDGEGTPGTRPQTETPRLGRAAVVNPGPTDSEIRGVHGGGSLPMDMKDPVRPNPPK